MPVDYDLVILGGTVEGRVAAMQAARYGARVALVEVPGLFEANQQQRYLLECLQQLSEGINRQAVGEWFGLRSANLSGADLSGANLSGANLSDADLSGGNGYLDWGAVLSWSAIAAETQSASLSADVLSMRGVDVVLEVPERLTRSLVVTTASRRLRSRSVMAAFGLAPDAVAPLMQSERLPDAVVIEGGDLRAVAWAQVLSALGVAVTLQAGEVLAGWDESIRGLVRSQLAASSVRLSMTATRSDDTQSNKTQSNRRRTGKNRAGDSGLKVVCTLPFDTESPALSLPQFVQGSVRQRNKNLTPCLTTYLSVNSRLQSAHPRVFACGSLLGSVRSAALTRNEADVALKNALFLPKHRANADSVPVAATSFAKIGLSEQQARQHYGASSIVVWEADDASSTDLSSVLSLPKYCKLVCYKNTVVGVHVSGRGADELTSLLTYVKGKSIKHLAKISGYYAPSSSLSRVVWLAANQACQSRWQVGCWRRDWAENWFNWRRSR